MNRLIFESALAFSLIFGCTEKAAVKSEDALVEGRALAASDYLAMRVLPEKSEVAAGRRLPFRAIGILPYGRDADLTDRGQFESSDPEVFDFPKDQSHGTGIAMKAGKVTITFSFEDIEISTELTVKNRVLDQFKLSQDFVQIAIEKADNVFEERKIQLHATGIYSDGSSDDLNSVTTWTLADENSVKLISDQPGALLTKAPGKVLLTAKFEDKSQSVEIEIVQGSVELKGLSISPSPLLLPLQTAKELKVTALYSDGTTATVTDSAEFSVTPPNLAILLSNGASGLQIASQSLGLGTLSVSYKEITSEFQLAAVDAQASTLRLISGRNFSLDKGLVESFEVWLDSSDGSTENVTTRATWSVSSQSILSPVAGTKGRYTALRVGTASLTATLGGLTASRSVSVTAAVISSIAITSSCPTPLGLYQTCDYTATASYSDATSKVLTTEVVWSFIAGTGMGSFDSTLKSRFQGLATGTGTIRASSGTVVTPVAVTIGEVVPVNLSLQSSWTSLSLASGAQQLTALLSYSDGHSDDVTALASWNYQIVGAGLNFAGYVSDTAPTKGRCVPVAIGFYKATASYLGMQAEKSLQVTP